jgi:hypothetical protein
MTSFLSATDILELQYKALELAFDTYVLKKEDGYELKIDICEPEYGGRIQTVFITNENESTWNQGDYEFSAMMEILDEKLEEQRQNEIKAQKRKELIESLTPEQRELLGV